MKLIIVIIISYIITLPGENWNAGIERLNCFNWNVIIDSPVQHQGNSGRESVSSTASFVMGEK